MGPGFGVGTAIRLAGMGMDAAESNVGVRKDGMGSLMSVEDVYLLMQHEPYTSSEHPVPIDATIVHALTLLHPAVPQPDGGRMYRCLTEFPSRTPGCLVLQPDFVMFMVCGLVAGSGWF